jgi:hypothetical protein
VKKIYPSSAGFAWGNLVFTDFKTACLRNVLLSSQGVKEGDIDEKYKVMGKLHEDIHEELLKGLNAPYKREEPVRHPVDGVDGVEFSGRVDFLLADSIDELKSTDSKNTKRDIIQNGHVRTEHLAQITAYMISLKMTKGRLIYGHYEKSKETGEYEKKSERCFEINIDDWGRICVDMTPTQFTVGDQLRHRLLSAKVVSEELVWDRPNNWNVAFKSPCTHCPWHEACNKYDDNLIERSTSAFVKEAKQISETLKKEKK